MIHEPQTALERINLLLIDEAPDRLLSYPLVTSHAARVLGVSVRDYVTDARLLSEGQVAAWQRYGHDALAVFTTVGLLAEALGSTFSYPEEDVPYLEAPALEDEPLETLERLALDEGEWLGRGRLPMYLEATERCHEAAGDRVMVVTYVPAPFTTAAMLAGVESFLLSLIEDPARAQAVLQLCAHVSRCFAVRALERGGLPMLADPLASGSVIGADHFRAFVKPHTRHVLDHLRARYDLDTMYHVCGRTGALLEELGDCGAELLSLDQVDLARANAVLGKQVRLIGNLSPSRLLTAEPERVERELESMIQIGKTVPKGFIAATGCEVPIEAPPEHVARFVQACRRFGNREEDA